MIPKVSKNSTGCKQEHSSEERVVLQTMKKSPRLFTDTACDLTLPLRKVRKTTYSPVRTTDRIREKCLIFSSTARMGRSLLKSAIRRKRIPLMKTVSSDVKPRDRTIDVGRRRATAIPAAMDR